MALKEETKQRIYKGCKNTMALLGEPPPDLGPVDLVQQLIDKSADTNLSKDVAENRKEAEQYLAGLLGMM